MLNQALKQRLVGAAVLVGMGVLVVPSLLKWPSGTVSHSMHGTAVVPERSHPGPVSIAEPSSSPPPLSSQESRNRKVSGWTVQIGSFIHRENALRMRNGAISSGYRAFIESVHKGNQTVYKVRVGSKGDVSRAKALKRELARQLHTNAFLISPAQ